MNPVRWQVRKSTNSLDSGKLQRGVEFLAPAVCFMVCPPNSPLITRLTTLASRFARFAQLSKNTEFKLIYELLLRKLKDLRETLSPSSRNDQTLEEYSNALEAIKQESEDFIRSLNEFRSATAQQYPDIDQDQFDGLEELVNGTKAKGSEFAGRRDTIPNAPSLDQWDWVDLINQLENTISDYSSDIHALLRPPSSRTGTRPQGASTAQSLSLSTSSLQSRSGVALDSNLFAEQLSQLRKLFSVSVEKLGIWIAAPQIRTRDALDAAVFLHRVRICLFFTFFHCSQFLKILDFIS